MRYVLALLAMLSPAYAQQQCGPTDRVAELLGGAHGEAVIGRGLVADQFIAMTWANPETGSWTITVTDPRGITCIVIHGTDWDAVEPVRAPNL